MPMRVVTIHIPEPYLEALDELVKRREFPNRAEAIRYAIRRFITEELQKSDGAD